MNEPMQNPYPPNVQAELARERNHIAAERSLLSFIRNSVTLISIGFGIDRVLKNLSSIAPNISNWAYFFSLLLVGLGVINLIFAILDHQAELKRLRQPEYYFTPRWSLGGLTGLLLFIVGFIAFVRLGIDYLG
jgi:putative membrane protein